MDKFELIKRGTQEIVDESEIKKLLKEKKTPVVYWGTAPTGRVHIGYFIPLMKIVDFLKAGFKVKVLIADLHAFLDDQKTPWNLLDERSQYYEECIKGILDALKVKYDDKLEFVEGSEFQLGQDYSLDVLRLGGSVTLNRAKRAASEVVRFKEEPKLGGFIYPLMQILDPVYLKADVSFSGVDQRGIYMLGREMLPELEYTKPICVFTPMLPGLTGEKMSASTPKSKIDLLDDPKDVEKKINSAYCIAGEVDNGVLVFIKQVIFPLKGKITVERDKKYGGNVEYSSYDKIEKNFKDKKLHPLDLKKSLAKEINLLLEPVRKRFKSSKNKELLKRAYP